MTLPNPAQALQRLFDGDFESGTLIGWVPGKAGSANLASRGRCFAQGDTTGLSIRGKYAALLRGSPRLNTGKSPSLTSKPFTAGTGILFMALSELNALPDAGLDPPQGNTLLVSILGADGEIYAERQLDTATIKLNSGCPSAIRDQSFSEHYISTRAYLGQTIKIRFSLTSERAQTGLFSLIDQISIVQAGETATYAGLPIARAGLIYDELSQRLYLQAGQLENSPSFAKNVSWQIDGEAQRRLGDRSCINDLSAGNYHATLYVEQDSKLATDSLHFFVAEAIPELKRVDCGDRDTSGESKPLSVFASTDTQTTGVPPK